MADHDKSFDFWYAVNNTEVLHVPSGKLETFGATVVNYHLITEMMDSVNQVRVREGKLQAHRPEILTPGNFMQDLLEGFGEEAQKYMDWLHKNEDNLLLLQYGFVIRKQELNEYTITDRIDNVTDRIKKDVISRNDPLSAVVLGVDDPWEVCLLKLMVELVQQSTRSNVHELHQKKMLPQQEGERVQMRIEHAFRVAAKDRSRLDALAAMLKKYGLFEQYEDRFFQLVRTHQ